MKNTSFGILRITLILALAVSTLSVFAQASNPLAGKKILVYSATKGYRHSSIKPGQIALFKMAKEKGFSVDTTENAANFTEKNLKQYRIIVFLNTTMNVLNDAQQIAFERYIQAGGAYFGIHAATDTEYDWPWYTKLAGGQFASHPGNPNVQKGKFTAVDRTHISTAHMPETFDRTDEFYDTKNFNKEVKVLITVDEKTYKDGKMGDFHPMAWYHEYDGGRAFYTNWGHTHESFEEPLVVQHIWGALQWLASGRPQDYTKKLRSELPPEENRFNKVVLDRNLDEPTELAVTDAGKVFFGERKGKLKMYDPKKGKTKVIADLDVFSKFEYGLMGVNIDPDYNKNHWMYLFYSPQTGKADTAQHLSRFTYDDVNDTLIMSSEKVLLRIPVKRDGCCHTGGSIAWDKSGNLFLSTGDDTNPIDSNGYGPMDNRPGRSGWDARASSSNTNDLRGKILRIKPTPEGGYTIPEGNLYPAGIYHAKPEIYVMGNRNPYRISVDKRTGFLYWGEVGPDAGEDSKKYGPRGHDEVNQARQAGYFGWPLFVADNRPYNQRDFANDSTWAVFNPKAPINTSPHNTGFSHLPAAQKAFIYYPYVDSPEFGPVITKGSRNAMAGPIYYRDDFPATSKTKFPAYYDGKFFAYDWSRDLIYTVSMNDKGDFVQMERFLPNMTFSHPIDLEFDKNGTMYGLEYGPNWFAASEEAALYKIEYNAGNRTPKVIVSVDKPVGALPLKAKFSSVGTVDYDGDAIKYTWNFGDGGTSTAANPMHVFTKAGVYNVKLTVKDAAGNSKSEVIKITAGNEVPAVDVTIEGNKSFYWNDKPVTYKVSVQDKEDGSLANKKITEDEVMMQIDYLEGFDKTVIAQGHQANTSLSAGKRLIDLSDCKTCHAIDKKSVGPSYTDVSKKYPASSQNIDELSKKIINGGGGVWGENAMAAHPQVSVADAREMVKYILGLADKKKASKPVAGQYVPQDKGKPGTYIFRAMYTDKGAGKIAPVTGSKVVTLRDAKIPAVNADASAKTMKFKVDGIGEILVSTGPGGHARYDAIDLTGIKNLSVMATYMKGQTVGGMLELRTGSVTGPLLGSVEVNATKAYDFPINTTGVHDVYLVFVNDKVSEGALYALMNLNFQN